MALHSLTGGLKSRGLKKHFFAAIILTFNFHWKLFYALIFATPAQVIQELRDHLVKKLVSANIRATDSNEGNSSDAGFDELYNLAKKVWCFKLTPELSTTVQLYIG